MNYLREKLSFPGQAQSSPVKVNQDIYLTALPTKASAKYPINPVVFSHFAAQKPAPIRANTRSQGLHEEAMNMMRFLCARLDSAAGLRQGGFEKRN